MAKIRYKLFNGKEIEVEASEEVADTIADFEDESERERWRDHKRGEISMYALEEKGFMLVDTNCHIQKQAELNMDINLLRKAISFLNESQKLLIYKVYFEEIPLQDLATEEGVTYQAIQNRLKKILKKLKKFLD